MYIRLTLAELETLASLGLTWLLALDRTRVASHEAFAAQSTLVLGVDLDQRASNAQTQSLGLALVTTTNQVDCDVILLGGLKGVKRLLDNELKDGVGEVLFQRAMAALRRPTALILSIVSYPYLSLLMSITLGCWA